MNRRSFLKLLGLAGAGLVVPELVEPRRKIWQVSRAAPVAPLYKSNINWATSMRDSISLFAPYVGGVTDGWYPLVTHNVRSDLTELQRRQIRELIDSMSSKHRPLMLHDDRDIIVLPASVDLKFVDLEMTPSPGRGYVTIEDIKT